MVNHWCNGSNLANSKFLTFIKKSVLLDEDNIVLTGQLVYTHVVALWHVGEAFITVAATRSVRGSVVNA